MNSQASIALFNKDESLHNLDSVLATTPKKTYPLTPMAFFQNSSHLIHHDKENSFLKSNSRLHLGGIDQVNDQNFAENYQNNYGLNSGNSHFQNQSQANDIFSSYPFSSMAGGFQHPQQISQTNGLNNMYYGIESGYGQYLQNTGGNSCFLYNNKTPLTYQKMNQNILLQKSEQRLQNRLNLLVDVHNPDNQLQPADQHSQRALGIMHDEELFGDKKNEVTDFCLSALVGKVNISEFGASCDGNEGQGSQYYCPTSQPVSAFSLITAPQKSTNIQSKNISSAPNKSISTQKRIVKNKTKSSRHSHNSTPSHQQQMQMWQQMQAMNYGSFPQSHSSLENNLNLTNQTISTPQLQENLIANNSTKDASQTEDTTRGLSAPIAKQSASKRRQTPKNASIRQPISAKQLQQENQNLPILKFDPAIPQQAEMFASVPQGANNTLLSGLTGGFSSYINPKLNEDFEEEEEACDEEDGEDDEDDEQNDDEIDMEEEGVCAGQNAANNTQQTQPQRKVGGRVQKTMKVKQSEGEQSSGQEKRGDDVKPCNCRNSKCLKRYCDCFAAGIFCSAECKCEECHNKPEYEEERQKAIQKKKKRIKDAFLPVIHNNTHIKGCHCKNSHCQKKYCVCHQNGVLCSSLCQCVECENKIAEMVIQEQQIQLFYQDQHPHSPYQHYQQQPYIPQQEQYTHQILGSQQQHAISDSNHQTQQSLQIPPLPPQTLNDKHPNRSHSPSREEFQGDQIEAPSTIKKHVFSSGQQKQTYDEDFSTHKKPSKRRTYKAADGQKALQFFNEISPADNKYPAIQH